MGRDNFQRKQGKGKRDPFDERKPRKADKFWREKRREAKDAARWR